jgi:hypothetical protein
MGVVGGFFCGLQRYYMRGEWGGEIRHPAGVDNEKKGGLSGRHVGAISVYKVMLVLKQLPVFD